MASYKGSIRMENLYSDNDYFLVKVKISPKDIYMLTRIFEGYSHLGFAAPFDAENGIVAIYTTPENKQMVLEILNNLPLSAKII